MFSVKSTVAADHDYSSSINMYILMPETIVVCRQGPCFRFNFFDERTVVSLVGCICRGFRYQLLPIWTQ